MDEDAIPMRSESREDRPPGRGAWVRAVLRPGPLATGLLAATLVAHALVMRYAGGSVGDPVGPSEADLHYALLRCGAKSNALVLGGEPWRLVSCLFLHAGAAHLSLNAVGIWFLGRLTETVFGWRRGLVLFVVTGFSGALASFCASDALSVGGSGALFGLTGGLVGWLLKVRDTLPRRARRFAGVGPLAFLAASAAVGLLLPDVDNAAHIGGLLAGLAIGLALRSPLVPSRRPPAERAVTLAAGLALLVLGGTAALTVRAAARELPVAPTTLVEAHFGATSGPVPEGWSGGRLVARRCVRAAAGGAPDGAPWCFLDPYDSLLVVGDAAAIFEEGSALAAELTVARGPEPPVEREADGETVILVAAGEGWTYVLACYPELAYRYRPLASALYQALRRFRGDPSRSR